MMSSNFEKYVKSAVEWGGKLCKMPIHIER